MEEERIPSEPIPARYLCQEEDGTLQILRMIAQGTEAVIPETIEGVTVTGLGAYAFSSHMGQEPQGSWREQNNSLGLAGEQILCGTALEAVTLPSTLRRIGRYAFYDCKKLKRLTVPGKIANIGSGAFNCCDSLSELEITIDETERSCLREILSELTQEIHVRGTIAGERISLVFPSYYEEIQENTPARIFETVMHGCGNRYRYCFLQNQLQIREYDELFPYAREQASVQTVAALALGRLMNPWRLQEKYRGWYQSWLKEHLRACATVLCRQETREAEEQLLWLAAHTAETEQELQVLLEEGSGKPSLVSLLMEEKHKRFQGHRKRFSF